MSQTTNIDKKNKTVTLDSLQLKEVDKGLRNEKRQRLRVKELESALLEKDSIIKSLTFENTKLTDALISKVNEVDEVSDENDTINQDLIDNEKSKNKNGFYLGLEYLTAPLDSPIIDLKYKRANLIFSGGIGQINSSLLGKETFYKFGLSILIF